MIKTKYLFVKPLINFLNFTNKLSFGNKKASVLFAKNMAVRDEAIFCRKKIKYRIIGLGQKSSQNVNIAGKKLLTSLRI